jgi:hypothetical protein
VGGNALTGAIRGVSAAAVNALKNAGMPTTLGQTFGQSGKLGAMVKGIEDRAAGLPIVGDVINSRRREGIAMFNEKAFAKALEPLGGQIKGKVGEEAVAEAQRQVRDAFNNVLGGKSAVLDRAFAGKLTGALNQAAQLPRVGGEILDGIRDVFEPYFGKPNLTGQEMQQISRELQGLKASYKKDPLAHRITKAINSPDDSLLEMFNRHFAGMIPEYGKARKAYRKVSILEDAVLKAKNSDGVFTPAQLGAADRSNRIKYSGKRAAARGEGPFHDHQRNAQAVLPNAIPDSGTGGRNALLLAGAGIVGSDAYAGDGVSPAGLTMGLIVAGAYTKAGQRLLTKPGRGVGPNNVLRRPTSQRLIRSGAASGTVATGIE